MTSVLESDFTLLPADAKDDPAYRWFVEEMKGRAYGHEALNDAWLWFKAGFHTSALPPDVLAVLRDPTIPLPGEEGAMNALLASGVRLTDAAQVVLARSCRKCLGAEHPYWHPANSPCPSQST